MASERAADVLAYLAWWDYMLWRESHRLDPAIEWVPDLSWDEVAAMVGVPPPRLRPGDVPDAEVALALYWPGEPPVLRCTV